MTCAWCPGFRAADPANAGLSHGICPVCRARFDAELNNASPVPVSATEGAGRPEPPTGRESGLPVRQDDDRPGAAAPPVPAAPPASRPARIAALNDAFRRRLIGGPVPGQTVMTRGVAQLPPETVAAVLDGVRTFATWERGNDPYGEHDFGALTVAGESFLWKIDYYADVSVTYGSEDPSDPARSYRVLTIMLAVEY